jgi:transposase InsO family protein
LKKIYEIVVNHKKLVKILDRLGFSNKYTKHLNKYIKRSRARTTNKPKKPEILRTDNGSIFKSFETSMYLYDEDIVQEFGYNHNPDSQAHIESSFSSLKREFTKNNVFLNLNDVCSKLKVHLSFYNN